MPSSALEDALSESLGSGRQIQLVCIKNAFDVVRSRVPPHGETVMVRTGISEVRPVSGEIFTLEVERTWVFGSTRYAKGLITDSRLEADRLQLEPLAMSPVGLWDPEEHRWLFDELGDDAFYEEIQGAGARPQYEMEQVLPEDVVQLRWEEDPILEAVELANSGAIEEAEALLGSLLIADLRCLDAHAHLGHFELRQGWPGAVERAARHYRAGCEIAGLGTARGFDGLLPWGLLDNRPYLRCLHGLGLCLWRCSDTDGAKQIFRRMLWLNPYDNQGARFLLDAIEKGLSWEGFTESET
ncbi:MAG: hypothetical protein KDD11_22800 [Acidobacteria bacterium]|nr:hypothetical protein [Acidobacteriota bacterium]